MLGAGAGIAAPSDPLPIPLATFLAVPIFRLSTADSTQERRAASILGACAAYYFTPDGWDYLGFYLGGALAQTLYDSYFQARDTGVACR